MSTFLGNNANKTPLQRRRMTSPADMTRSALSLPEQPANSSSSPKGSPNRSQFIPNTFTGINPDDSDDDSDTDSEDDQHTRHKNYPYRSSSPSSSVSHLAASFAQRVGTFVAATRTLSSSSGNALPTDAELEAEAHKDRERSRKEAELILTREAEERRMAEEKILAMKERGDSLPPPPSRTQTMSNPPSPSSSPRSKDGTSWWTAAKSRLTPTKDKDPLTPAQQVILETKARENQQKKGKEKETSTEPVMLNLNIPHGPPSRPVPTSPVSPTPARNQAPILTPSPMRSNADGAPSPSREAPPLYAQFTTQGTLDVHGTLLTIVKRFEKLEKWTVGHVRALEERMNDVERWLVEKEMEKEDKGDPASVPSEKNRTKPQQLRSSSASAPAAAADKNVTQELTDMREELNELQGRVGVLGREMARISTPRHPPALTPAAPPAPAPAPPAPAPSPSSSPPPSLPGSMLSSSTPHTPHHPRLSSTTARDSTSPPIAGSSSSKRAGTRLPYPTGDYASPPDNLFSPPHSPPGSLTRSAVPSNTTTASPNANATATSTGLFTSSSSSSGSSFSSAPISSIPSRPLPASPKSTPPGSVSASTSASSFARVASPPPLLSSASVSHTHQPLSSSLNSLSLPASTLPPPPKIPAASSSASSSPSGSPSGKGGKTTKMRQSSVSPTPRKRYTVALGEPIVSREPPPQQVQESSFSGPKSSTTTPVQKRTHSRNQSIASTASFMSDYDAKSDSENGQVRRGKGHDEETEEEIGDEDEDGFQDETIGRRASARVLGAGAQAAAAAAAGSRDTPPSPSPLSRRARVRPQSAYDFNSFLKQPQLLQTRSSQQSLQSNKSNQSNPSLHSLHSPGSIGSQGSIPVAPLAIKSRWRSQSTDRGGGGSSSSLSSLGSVNVNGAKFGELKKKHERGVSREKGLPLPKAMGKLAVGDLVAFFDGEKKDKV